MVEYGLWALLECPILWTVSDTDPPTITFTQIHSYTAHVSQWTDEELEHEIQLICQPFLNAGITMLHGHFHQMGENVPRECICQALNRMLPANWPFHQPPLIHRRYQVPGPNYLWHHDGQHGKSHTFLGYCLLFIIALCRTHLVEDCSPCICWWSFSDDHSNAGK